MLSITAATVWVVMSIALSLLMVLGYALFDLGSIRPKNTPGTIVRHLVVTCATVLFFLFMGFGLYFGGNGGFFGVLDFFTLGNYGPTLPDGVSLPLFVASQLVVCVAAANIVCGTLAERSSISAQIGISLVIGLLVFPFVNRWTWGTGWLAERGFHDFVGSASLNVTAGTTALIGAVLMGPRAGKYEQDGSVSALPGQSLMTCMVGTLLIVIGWFGLVGVSLPVYGVADGEALGQAFLSMLLVPSVALLTSAVISQLRYSSLDIPMMLNAFIGGLVSISCGADIIHPALGVLLGIVAGCVVVFGIEVLERCLRIDDPVGAIAAHGICGLLGFVFVGIFAPEQGLLAGNVDFFLVEILGALAIVAWSAFFSWAVFEIIQRATGLRVMPSEEEGGLGLSGPSLNNAYSAYMPALSPSALQTGTKPVPDLPASATIPLELAAGADTAPLKKVEIICRPQSLEHLREALRTIGVTGMTVYEVQGCGEQKGARESYRGVPVDVGLIPKVKVDMVVSRVPVSEVVRATREALYTGHIGDGKIFIYGVAEAIKVRTGEHGYDAVQNFDEAPVRA